MKIFDKIYEWQWKYIECPKLRRKLVTINKLTKIIDCSEYYGNVGSNIPSYTNEEVEEAKKYLKEFTEREILRWNNND